MSRSARSASIQPPAASALKASSVRRTLRAGSRPPAISCWTWQKNSTERIPPSPFLMSKPSRSSARRSRLSITRMSSSTVKSRELRQMNGTSVSRKASPSAMLPAIARERI